MIIISIYADVRAKTIEIDDSDAIVTIERRTSKDEFYDTQTIEVRQVP